MPRIVPLVFFALAVPAFAQQQQPEQQPTPQQKAEKERLERIRVEGAVGGVGNVTPEKRRRADVGAGPHLRRQAPGGSRWRAEVIPPPGEQPAAGGGTRE